LPIPVESTCLFLFPWLFQWPDGCCHPSLVLLFAVYRVLVTLSVRKIELTPIPSVQNT
jgi:hypothetical protein